MALLVVYEVDACRVVTATAIFLILPGGAGGSERPPREIEPSQTTTHDAVLLGFAQWQRFCPYLARGNAIARIAGDLTIDARSRFFLGFQHWPRGSAELGSAQMVGFRGLPGSEFSWRLHGYGALPSPQELAMTACSYGCTGSMVAIALVVL